MATDNTPPRLRLIATIAVIVVITLIGIDFVLNSYYAYMTDEAHHEKLAPLTARDDERRLEAASLANAAMPIDQAMAQMKGARSALIEPKPSDDMGPMTGWSKLPKQPPLAAPAGAPNGAGADGGAMMGADGGAMMGADGGAAMMAMDAGAMAADAGPPKRNNGAQKDAGH